MRQLTVTRNKSFAACFMKMKVYIEDPSAGELTIGDTPCRLLGKVKNGESVTFPVGEEAARVYVIADRMTRNLCNGCYALPEGQEDVTLTGRNYFNLSNGNAFVFDGGASSETALALQKRSFLHLGILAGILILFSWIGWFIGGMLSSPAPAHSGAPKTFSADGFSITLTDRFEKTEAEQFVAAYDARDAAVFVSRDPFEEGSELAAMTVQQYADLIIELNSMTDVTTHSFGDAICLERDTVLPDSDETYHYTNYVFKTDDAFWMIEFCVHTKDAETYAPIFDEWITTVRFD